MAEFSQKQLKTLKKLLETAETNLAGAKELLVGLTGDETAKASAPSEESASLEAANAKIVEGVFDGQSMTGPGGKLYPVPANYASKSKLVQGDVLKLTIADDGSFIYKQIGPIERRKLIGSLNLKDGQYSVEAEGVHHRVLFASVSYFRAQPGDQVTIVLPRDGQADWAAIEAVLV